MMIVGLSECDSVGNGNELEYNNKSDLSLPDQI